MLNFLGASQAIFGLQGRYGKLGSLIEKRTISVEEFSKALTTEDSKRVSEEKQKIEDLLIEICDMLKIPSTL